MTHICSSIGKRVETDCHQTSPILNGFSRMNTTLANDNPNPKHPKVSPQRRQSQRIKAINAIYTMADTRSSELLQTSPENSPCSSEEFKVESIDTLDDPSIGETLNDMRERCKAKKRKAVRSLWSSNADLNHEPKEEESDLDEPLISLKLKKLNKSSASRKRRKCSLFEEISQVEERFGSSPTELDRSSSLKEVASGAGSLTTTESVNGNMEVDTCKAVSSSQIIIDNCNNHGGSSIELFHRASEGELANSESFSSPEKYLHPGVINRNSSPPTVSQVKASLAHDVSQHVFDKVKKGAIEIDSLESKTSNGVPNHVDFIAKFSSDELHDRNDGSESQIEDFTIFTTDHLDCCVNEISVEFMETDKCTSIPESCKDHFGKKINIGCSEISRHNLSSFSDWLQLASENTDLVSDVYGGARNFNIALEEVIYDGRTRNHPQNLEPTQECTLIDRNTEPRMTREFDNQGDDVPSPRPSICGNKGNATAELSLHGTDFHDFCFSEEAGSLNSLVLEALRGDPRRNSNADHANFHIEKISSVGTYDPCALQHPNMINKSSCNLGDSNEVSPENVDLRCSRVVDQMLNDVVEKTAEIDPACDLSIPAAEKLCTIGDKLTCPSSNNSNLVEGEECHTENKIKFDQGIEYHPKKLLLNRKDLSPTSQEKLRRALSSSELDDSIKTANNDEAETMPSPEKTTKKSKSSTNGSVQWGSKGVLKSISTPDRNCPCAKNSLVDTQAQKAATFSQRQMQDIEAIATKLLKGLASMKNIVVENVGSEACLSASSKFTSEQVRMAIENASNLEATTKKWLYMMAKDCNRFCKIMMSTENKETAPLSVRKQPKKITFADEAGGLLCHVKVFEQHTS